jgi:long-subunit acyl-CoA synthetase (AMP-forming)
MKAIHSGPRDPVPTYKDLTADEDIHKLIQSEVDQVNSQVARVENVRKFTLRPKKRYEEDGEGSPHPDGQAQIRSQGLLGSHRRDVCPIISRVLACTARS